MKKAWLIVLTASLFFFYEFIQMNLMSGISDAVMSDLKITATQFGWLASIYFLATVLFLFIAGMLLDRYSTRLIILISLGVCIAGIILFAISENLSTALLARFFSGIGSAFCFLSVIRLATRWFPPKKLAFVTGCIVTMAMSGALVSQTPLIILLEHVTWRQALWWDAAFGVLAFLVIAVIIKDHSESEAIIQREERQQLSIIGYGKSIKLAFLQTQNWLAGAYSSLMNLIVILLGGTWGKLYLMNVHDLSAIKASYITSLLFIGAVIGGPIAGGISDAVRQRRIPMMIGAVLSLALVLLLQLFQPNYLSLLILFLAIGMVTSTQVLSYPYVAENSPRLLTAMSVSVVNISSQAGLFFSEPLFGYLIDLKHKSIEMSPYIGSDFEWAMMVFPISFIIAIMISFKLREKKKLNHSTDKNPKAEP